MPVNAWKLMEGGCELVYTIILATYLQNVKLSTATIYIGCPMKATCLVCPPAASCSPTDRLGSGSYMFVLSTNKMDYILVLVH